MKPTGFLCGPRLYEYDGWLFEKSASNGPWPLTKDMEPRKRAGKAFWAMIDRFCDERDREQFRVDDFGGCQPI